MIPLLGDRLPAQIMRLFHAFERMLFGSPGRERSEWGRGFSEQFAQSLRSELANNRATIDQSLIDEGVFSQVDVVRARALATRHGCMSEMSAMEYVQLGLSDHEIELIGCVLDHGVNPYIVHRAAIEYLVITHDLDKGQES